MSSDGIRDPGSAAWLERVNELVSAEFAEASVWWWLSFADPERAAGEQFLGVAIINAPGMMLATARAHHLGINPGGDVQGYSIPDEHLPSEPLRERLLTLAELQEAGLVG